MSSLVLSPPSGAAAAAAACLDENVALDLLDGTLSTAARTNVEKHLEECDACRELVAELAQIAQANSQEPFEAGRPADTERTPYAASSPSKQGSAGGDDGGAAFILREGTRAGPYRIEHPIGSGAAGTVYRAIDERNGRVVALKHVTDTMMRTRFLREAETLRRLDHPGIVRYIDHGETSAGMYLAMEWLEGEDLEQHSRRVGAKKIPWRDVRVIGDRLASALAHAHMFGAVHRDLSPKNVFLVDRRFDQAKLLDFGLVRIPDAGPERTASQAVLGTPFYMSPEQVRDPKSVDARSDLFGLGVLLFEMLAGKRPFEGEDLFTVWVRIVDQQPPDLRALVPDVPEPFIRLVEALLAKEPNARPPSASDVQRVLQKLDGIVLGGPGGTATLPPLRPNAATYPPPSPPVLLPTPPPPPPPPTKRSSGVFVAASVGVGVTAIVGATTLGVIYKTKGEQKDTTSQVEAGGGPASSPGISTATVAQAKAKAKAAGKDDDDDDDAPTSPSAAATATATATVTNNKSNARISTRTPAKGEDPNAEVQSQPNLACGSDDVVVRRNMHFKPDPNMPPGVGDSVFVGGDCKLTLEDCVIDGPRSLKIMNQAVVTLRRCKVLGKVELIGPTPILHLYDTTLPQAASVVGPGAKVIKH